MKKRSNEFSREFSGAMSKLLDKPVSIDIGPAVLDDEGEPLEPTTPTEGGTYQWPVQITRIGGPVHAAEYAELEEGQKPWIVGTFIPGKYINKGHPHGHNGMDLNAPQGTPIYPMGPGVVISTPIYSKGGKTVKIVHENGRVGSYYAHMHSVSVSPGQEVGPTTVIGTVGQTGNATSDHLHWETSLGKLDDNGRFRASKYIDPHSIIGRPVGSLSKAAESIKKMYNIFEKFSKSQLNKQYRAVAIKKIAAELDMDFKLTDKEKDVFNLLLKVVEDKAPTTNLRVAGGWVRDKLMVRPSHDIDVVTDNISGKKFAELALKWMKENGYTTADEVTIVDANVEANKHMESAMLPVLGFHIDFAQLRTEVYDSKSRNPKIVVGVLPEEDAKRRDLTINSLFYNINTGQIEDYVGGIEDIKKRGARTPIDPLQTYLDDPLRILRLIRFAAKYDLELDPAAIEAAKNPIVQKALENKITKERIWTELAGQEEKDGWKRGFMIGPNFHKAAELLQKLGLRDLLLKPTKDQLDRAVERQLKSKRKSRKPLKWEEGFTSWEMDQNNPYHDMNIWGHTLASLKYLNELSDHPEANGRKEDDELVRNLAMLLHDIGKGDPRSKQIHPKKGHSTYHDHHHSSALMADEILKDLKAPNRIRERVVNLIRYHMRLHNYAANTRPEALRKLLDKVGEKDWPSLIEISKSDAMGKSKKDPDELKKYDVFVNVINDYLKMTGGKKNVKAPIDGREIMNILGLTEGKHVGQVVRALKEEMYKQPEMTKEAAIAFIKTVSVD